MAVVAVVLLVFPAHGVLTAGTFEALVPPFRLEIVLNADNSFVEAFIPISQTSPIPACVISGTTVMISKTNMKSFVTSSLPGCGSVFSSSFGILSSNLDTSGNPQMKFMNRTGTFTAPITKMTLAVPAGSYCTPSGASVPAAMSVKADGTFTMLVGADKTGFLCNVTGNVLPATPLTLVVRATDCVGFSLSAASYSSSKILLTGKMGTTSFSLSLATCVNAVASPVIYCGAVGSTMVSMALNPDGSYIDHFWNATSVGDVSPCGDTGNYALLPGGVLRRYSFVGMSGNCHNEFFVPFSTLSAIAYTSSAVTLKVGTQVATINAASCVTIPAGRYGGSSGLFNGAATYQADGSFVFYFGKVADGTLSCFVKGKSLAGTPAALFVVLDPSTTCQLVPNKYTYSASTKTITLAGYTADFKSTFSLAMPYLFPL